MNVTNGQNDINKQDNINSTKVFAICSEFLITLNLSLVHKLFELRTVEN